MKKKKESQLTLFEEKPDNKKRTSRKEIPPGVLGSVIYQGTKRKPKKTPN
jgi:hypothetical protein